MTRIAFGWQEKCLDLILQEKIDPQLMDAVYDTVTGQYGSGKKYLGDGDKYFSFMERKWQITYHRLLKINPYSRCGEVYRG